MGFNLAEINEAIAAAIPERECIVLRDRRLTWQDFNLRTRRLANFLISQGLGCHQERAGSAELRIGPDPSRPLSLQRQRVPRRHGRRVQGTRRALQRQLSLRRERADLPAQRRGLPRAHLPRPFRADVAEDPQRVAAPQGAAAGGRRVRQRAAARSRRLRRGATPVLRRAAGARMVRRRSLHPLHRRHDRACRRAYCGARKISSSARSVGTPWARPGMPRSTPWSRPHATARCAPSPPRRSCTVPRTGWLSTPFIKAAPWSSKPTRRIWIPMTSGRPSSARTSASLPSLAMRSDGHSSISSTRRPTTSPTSRCCSPVARFSRRRSSKHSSTRSRTS